MKKILVAVALLATCICQAQTRWINPLDSGAVVHGQGWEELRSTYYRLPDKAKDIVRSPVWGLSRNSAGLSIVFRSNASNITVRYQVTGDYSMYHMPSTGTSGIDMYATDGNGERRWCAPDFNYSESFRDTIKYNYSNLTYYNGNSYEYHLYLPPYNTVKWLQIGVPEDAQLCFYPESKEKPIVLYGTSIAQGACASRPGNAWPNIVERELEHPFVNLAFSGNGKLEPEVFRLLAEIDAKMYILDCMPNLHPSDPIQSLIFEGVKILRETRDCPIMIVEHSGYVNEVTSEPRSEFRQTNAMLREGYENLLAAGYKDIHYMTYDEIGMGMDGMVEGIHPNDLGMRRHADGHEKKIRSILHEDFSIAPLKQNRDSYIWHDRHEGFLAQAQEQKPEIVLIGDSITHYWGDDNGKAAWDKLWKGRKVLNMGCGWDRIENVLWRISHGELDGWNAQKVLILIGTNNLGKDSPEKIAKGISEIVSAVKFHQPSAEIYVCGISPRRDREKTLIRQNELIKIAVSDRAAFIDMTPELVGEDGKIIEKYFRDGLHPNSEGYKHFAEMIKEGLR